jgi:hypothetical protein
MKFSSCADGRDESGKREGMELKKKKKKKRMHVFCRGRRGGLVVTYLGVPVVLEAPEVLEVKGKKKKKRKSEMMAFYSLPV